ncbi:unnamed protein product [Mytilus edulis]|uniref:Uncharacterized protein n=1 Tax=Mytilus edulis TaxID=6550 RepID=A0A8S3VK43_MYTED|nr:unnamed protein product [Mytilus edulis]
MQRYVYVKVKRPGQQAEVCYVKVVVFIYALSVPFPLGKETRTASRGKERPGQEAEVKRLRTASRGMFYVKVVDSKQRYVYIYALSAPFPIGKETRTASRGKETRTASRGYIYVKVIVYIYALSVPFPLGKETRTAKAEVKRPGQQAQVKRPGQQAEVLLEVYYVCPKVKFVLICIFMASVPFPLGKETRTASRGAVYVKKVVMYIYALCPISFRVKRPGQQAEVKRPGQQAEVKRPGQQAEVYYVKVVVYIYALSVSFPLGKETRTASRGKRDQDSKQRYVMLKVVVYIYALSAPFPLGKETSTASRGKRPGQQAEVKRPGQQAEVKRDQDNSTGKETRTASRGKDCVPFPLGKETKDMQKYVYVKVKRPGQQAEVEDQDSKHEVKETRQQAEVCYFVVYALSVPLVKRPGQQAEVKRPGQQAEVPGQQAEVKRPGQQADVKYVMLFPLGKETRTASRVVMYLCLSVPFPLGKETRTASRGKETRTASRGGCYVKVVVYIYALSVQFPLGKETRTASRGKERPGQQAEVCYVIVLPSVPFPLGKETRTHGEVKRPGQQAEVCYVKVIVYIYALSVPFPLGKETRTASRGYFLFNERTSFRDPDLIELTVSFTEFLQIYRAVEGLQD